MPARAQDTAALDMAFSWEKLEIMRKDLTLKQTLNFKVCFTFKTKSGSVVV